MYKIATVWSQPNCRFCDMAKALLKVRGWDVQEMMIGKNTTKEAFLEANPGMRSVPQIHLNGNSIGGYDKLKVLIG